MDYTYVRKRIPIEIKTKFNSMNEKGSTGDTVSNICKRYEVSRKTHYSGRVGTRGMESKGYRI